MEPIVNAEFAYPAPSWRSWCYHFAMFAVAVAVLIAALSMKLNQYGSVFLPGSDRALGPSCYSSLFLGIDCPGCGLTRSFVAIGHGEFQRGFNYNPAGPVVFLFVLVQVPWQGYQLFRLWRQREPVYALWLFLPIALVNVSLLIQWGWRLTLGM